MVKPIPEGYHSVTPYLAVRNAAEAIDWYKQALGATESFRFEDGGKVVHAEIKVGDSIVMLSDEWREGGHLSPSPDGSPVSLMLYVDDVDSAFQRAIDAGANEIRAVKDQFYGDRSGTLSDPFGHRWHVATHVEDVEESELQRRMEESKAEWKQPEPAA
jgi:PhnB protein